MPICLARVATSSCSVRMPSSTRTRPSEWPTRRCSARAASSWAGETLPSSSRSCPSCLVWFAIAVRRACPRAPLQPPHAADQPLQHRLGGVGVGSTLRGGGLRLGGGGLRLGGGGLAGDGEKAALDHGGEGLAGLELALAGLLDQGGDGAAAADGGEQAPLGGVDGHRAGVGGP